MGDNIKQDLNQWRAGIKLIYLRTVTLEGEWGAVVEKKLKDVPVNAMKVREGVEL
jgi:hypothetical protein